MSDYSSLTKRLASQADRLETQIERVILAGQITRRLADDFHGPTPTAPPSEKPPATGGRMGLLDELIVTLQRATEELIDQLGRLTGEDDCLQALSTA